LFSACNVSISTYRVNKKYRLDGKKLKKLDIFKESSENQSLSADLDIKINVKGLTVTIF